MEIDHFLCEKLNLKLQLANSDVRRVQPSRKRLHPEDMAFPSRFVFASSHFSEWDETKTKSHKPYSGCKPPVPRHAATVERSAPVAFPLFACVATLKIEAILVKFLFKKEGEIQRQHHPEWGSMPTLFWCLLTRKHRWVFECHLNSFHLASGQD